MKIEIKLTPKQALELYQMLDGSKIGDFRSSFPIEVEWYFDKQAEDEIENRRAEYRELVAELERTQKYIQENGKETPFEVGVTPHDPYYSNDLQGDTRILGDEGGR